MASTKTRKSPVKPTDDAVEAAIAAEMAASPDIDGPADDDVKPKAEKKPRFAPLAGDRALWVAANARPAVSSCLCGCGGSTKGRFVPGHDATLKESLKAGTKSEDVVIADASRAALETFGW